MVTRRARLALLAAALARASAAQAGDWPAIQATGRIAQENAAQGFDDAVILGPRLCGRGVSQLFPHT